MDLMVHNINNYCCGCLKPGHNLKLIDTISNESIKLVEMIFYLMDYPIEKCEDKDNEYYGGKLCTNCEESLTLSYYFKKQIEVSNKDLRNMCNHIKTEIETVIIKEEYFTVSNLNDNNKILSSQMICDIVESSQNIFKDEESVMHNFETDSLIECAKDNTLFELKMLSHIDEQQDFKDKLIQESDRTPINISEYRSHCKDLHSEITRNLEFESLLIAEKQVCRLCFKWILVKNVSAHMKKCHDIHEKTDDIHKKTADGNDREKPPVFKKFECSVCSTKFKTIATLRKHIRKFHKIQSEKVLKELKLKVKVIKKINEKQTSTMKIVCIKCGKSVIRKTMKEHMKMHANMRYECTVCDKTYRHRSSLSDHMRSHRNEKRYSCQYCGEKFLIWNTRRNHIRTFHSDVKYSIKCTFCDRNFSQRSGMLTHVRRAHTHEKRHQCSHCDKKFYTSSGKKNHETVHSNEKNFKCDICLNNFKSKKSLRAHMKIHTGEKNYFCPVCSKSFLYIQVLQSHMKTHPGLTIPPPGTILSQKFKNKEKQLPETTISENKTTEEY